MTFETYSAADLTKVGLQNYIDDDTFQPLLAAVHRYDSTEPLVIDFTDDYDHALAELYGQVVMPAMQGFQSIVAHNAGFERAVLKRMGYDIPVDAFIDSAVLARAYGLGGSLEAAAPQLLGTDKIESGKWLIQMFSVPGWVQEWHRSDNKFDRKVVDHSPREWEMFKHYCGVDATLSYRIAERIMSDWDMEQELRYAGLTMRMNNTGWPVDLDLVREMNTRYQDNINKLIQIFINDMTGLGTPVSSEFNIYSHKQRVEFCKARGVKATSFDEKSVRRLLKKVRRKMDNMPPDDPQFNGLLAVEWLLALIQDLGGSSLKKLDRIINTTASDSRLYDSYLHIGAQATYRTTGRGVQMQNLPRLYGGGDDVSELWDPKVHWTNDRMAHNLRQVFRASHPEGRLIVGDFNAIESRGLAWQAGCEWKLEAFRQGLDPYKMQAQRSTGVPYDEVNDDQRKYGKVGDLACGYGAGPGAVRAFAENMGVELTEDEAADLVQDWRRTNADIPQYWRNLDAVLQRAYSLKIEQVYDFHDEWQLRVLPVLAPASLRKQTGQPDLKSFQYEIWARGGPVTTPLLRRVIHGVHRNGSNLGYYKPTSRKTGNLWVNSYTDPKTGLKRDYSIYGGKFAGLLTQSLCREIFFLAVEDFYGSIDNTKNVRIVGQFHDELVVEWSPEPLGEGKYTMTLDDAKDALELSMTTQWIPGFPMAASIKDDARYTK